MTNQRGAIYAKLLTQLKGTYNRREPGIGTKKPTTDTSFGGGADIQEIARPSVERVTMEGIPDIDYRWTWRTETQAGFELTFKSLAAGLDRQRAPLESHAYNIASSKGLITHWGNDIQLAFKAKSANLDYNPLNPEPWAWPGPAILHTVAFGKVWWAWFVSGTELFSETSTVDPTPRSWPGVARNLVNLSTAYIEDQEALIIYPDSSGRMSAYTNPFSSVIGAPLNYANPYGGLIQVPLPKGPLLIRYYNQFYLLTSQWLSAAPTQPVTAVYTAKVAKFGHLIGLGAVGSRPPFVYWVEDSGKISYCNVYGLEFNFFGGIDMPLVRDAILVANGIAAQADDRIMFYDNQPWDTQIFRDPERVTDYYREVRAMWKVDDTLFACVAIVPTALKALIAANSTADPSYLPPIIAQIWRLDFDRLRWSPVSEELTYPFWNIAPYSLGSFGPAQGRAGLPYGPNTRYLHLPPRVDQALTYRKFEPPAASSPYQFRGVEQRASEGQARTPAFIWPKGPDFNATWLDKHFDGVYYNGQDSGGTGSYLRVRVAEEGHMDDTAPAPLTAKFTNPVLHHHRYYPWDSQAYLYPQFEFLLHGGTDNTQTDQVGPVTVVGHVNLTPRSSVSPWSPWGRSLR